MHGVEKEIQQSGMLCFDDCYPVKMVMFAWRCAHYRGKLTSTFLGGLNSMGRVPIPFVGNRGGVCAGWKIFMGAPRALIIQDVFFEVSCWCLLNQGKNRKFPTFVSEIT